MHVWIVWLSLLAFHTCYHKECWHQKPNMESGPRAIQRTPSDKCGPKIQAAQIINRIITAAFYLRWKHLGQVDALHMLVSTWQKLLQAKNSSKWSFKHWTSCCRELFPPGVFKNWFSRDAWSQLVPFSPETPIWKGRCQSDYFGFLGFFSNPSLHAPVSNCVSEHVESSPSSEIDKHYIALYCTIPVATAGAEVMEPNWMD